MVDLESKMACVYDELTTILSKCIVHVEFFTWRILFTPQSKKQNKRVIKIPPSLIYIFGSFAQSCFYFLAISYEQKFSHFPITRLFLSLSHICSVSCLQSLK